jgi:hypothetical protein
VNLPVGTLVQTYFLFLRVRRNLHIIVQSWMTRLDSKIFANCLRQSRINNKEFNNRKKRRVEGHSKHLRRCRSIFGVSFCLSQHFHVTCRFLSKRLSHHRLLIIDIPRPNNNRKLLWIAQIRRIQEKKSKGGASNHGEYIVYDTRPMRRK